MFGCWHADQDGPVCDSALVPVLAGFKPSQVTGAQSCSHKSLAWVFLLSTALNISVCPLRDGHSARAQSCSQVPVLPLQAALACFRPGFAVNSPVLLSLSPVPDLAPCTQPWGVSPSLSGTAPSHELSFCVIVWVWPFLCKDSKALHNQVLFTQSLCAQIILLNNDSSLYLQPQRNLPLFASGNFLPKAFTGGGVCFYST